MSEKIWSCPTQPQHTPTEPEGTDDGFSTCDGCGIDLWVGYLNDKETQR